MKAPDKRWQAIARGCPNVVLRYVSNDFRLDSHPRSTYPCSLCAVGAGTEMGDDIMKAAPVSNILKLLSVSALALLSVAARADIIGFQSNGRTVEVAYGDLDLSSKAGQQELNARIRRAAIKVCPARTVQESRPCQIAAIDQIREPAAAAVAHARGQARYAEARGKNMPKGGGD